MTNPKRPMQNPPAWQADDEDELDERERLEEMERVQLEWEREHASDDL